MIGHVRDSVQQVDENSWLIGDQFVLHRHASAPVDYLWMEPEARFWYTKHEAPTPLPATKPLPPDSHIHKIHDAGDASAVFSFGDAILKVKLIQREEVNSTKEHVTLDWLCHQKLSFDVPKVLHYVEAGDRKYILITRLPGQVLADLWQSMDEDVKQHYVHRAVEICKELAAWTSDTMTGVDGGNVADTWLDPSFDPQGSFHSDDLKRKCLSLGMDCTQFVLCHNDLGPHNIIVSSEGKGSLGIIDWEMAGYVPREWIRTKASVSWAMDFSWLGASEEEQMEWRVRLQDRLKEEGFPEVRAAWVSRYRAAFSHKIDK